jgi:hypothetical protein
MRNLRLALAGMSLAAAAACGTTVQLSGPAAGPGGAIDDGLNDGLTTAPPTSGSPANQPGGGLPGPVATGAVPTFGAATGQPTAGPTTGSGATAAPGRLANVPGVTATTVKIGLEYLSAATLGGFANSAGVKGVGAADPLEAFKAAVAAVNKAGGVAGGRKIEIVPRQRALSEDTAAAAQKSCETFTKDNRVLAAAVPGLAQGSPLVDCLAGRGVMAVGAGYAEAGSQRDFSRFAGRHVAVSTADTIAAARTYVDALVRQGLLTSKSKVGLIWFDFPDFKAARSDGILPALKAHGLKLDSEFQSSYSGNAGELVTLANQMQSASLRFRTAGVDRVLTLDFNGTLQYLFMNNAQQQGYHPLYGLASWSDAEFLRANGSAAQLAGSKGIGWLPAYDLSVGQQPTGAHHQRCAAAMKAADMPPVQAQGDVIIENQACDVVFFLADLLNSTRSLSISGLAQAAASLGSRPSYASFANTYSSNKLWGATTYRDLSFDAGAKRFSYAGPERPFR